MADKDSFEELVDKCIEMYRELLSSTLALDINLVQGKMRSMVLKDERYIRETRAIKAKQALNELREVEGIYSLIDGVEDEPQMEEEDEDDLLYDDRDKLSRKNRKKKKPVETKSSMSDKDVITMKLKAAQMKRDLLSDLADNSDDEADGINFFFCTVTREEMEKMKRVEIHQGAEDDEDVLDRIMSEESTEAPGNETGKVKTTNRPKAQGTSKSKKVQERIKELQGKAKKSNESANNIEVFED